MQLHASTFETIFSIPISQIGPSSTDSKTHDLERMRSNFDGLFYEHNAKNLSCTSKIEDVFGSVVRSTTFLSDYKSDWVDLALI